jgi:hypothetical protein
MFRCRIDICQKKNVELTDNKWRKYGIYYGMNHIETHRNISNAIVIFIYYVNNIFSPKTNILM